MKVRKKPLVITEVRYAPADETSRLKISRVLNLLLRRPLVEECVKKEKPPSDSGCVKKRSSHG